MCYLNMASYNSSTAERQSGLTDIDPDSHFSSSVVNYYSANALNNLSITDPFLVENFSTIFLNIRSAMANLDSFHDYLQTLSVNFSVIALAETWLNNDNEHLCTLPDYTYHGIIREGRGGGGVALLLHNSLRFKPRPEMTFTDESIEIVFVEVVYIPNQIIRPLIGVIYRPPNTNVDAFINKLTPVLHKIRRENKLCYLLGDFNLNLLNVSTHHPTNQFLDLLYAFSFKPLVDKPTRITANTSTLIDNIFCNSLMTCHMTGLLYCDVTDHLPIFFIDECNSYNTNERMQEISFRRINDNAILNFRQNIELLNWDEIYHSANCDDAYILFIEKFSTAYNESFPQIVKKINVRKINKPWITSSIKKSIAKRNKLYKLFHARPTLANEIRYKQYKKSLAHIIRYAKKSHYNSLLELHKSNMKESWKVLKEIIGLPTKSTLSKTFTTDDDAELTDSVNIANSFNDYFVNIGGQLASNIPNTSQDPINYLSGDFPNSIYLSPIDENEVSLCIMRLRDGCPGHDGIKPSVIKRCKDLIVTPLTHIFNMSIREGHVPDSLKRAYITPVFKSGDSKKFNSYRPISVLPSFSKVLERLIFKRLYQYLSSNAILSNSQFGFRQGLSTEMALITAIDFITDAIDKKETALGLFLDLRKAFDTVDKEILLNKLSYYGIRGNALSWFRSYLTNRSQSVKYFNTISNELGVNMGVPQGSILGPLLFILYVNDLPNILNGVKPIMFADDTTLFSSDKDINVAVDCLNQNLSRLSLWFKSNRLSLNVTKTNYMLFTTSPTIRSQDPVILIDNVSIKRVTNIKFLGVLIDERLNWSFHIDHICSKLRKNIGILSQISGTLAVVIRSF